MRLRAGRGLLALAALAVIAPVSQADIAYNGRTVGVRVGPGGVSVRAPGVGVDVGPGGIGVGVAPHAPPIMPPAGPPPVPLPELRGAPRPLTIEEFAASFRPAPGNFEVVLLHPFTHCPVKVCFSLPEGCPKVKVGGCIRRCIEFDYGKKEIEVWFYRDGRVKVKY